MKKDKTRIHFADNYIINPTNPIAVNLIGCGGTGTQVLTCLVRMHESLLALGHPGLDVSLFDDDVITDANRGRQLFFRSEIGLKKSVASIARVNRGIGTNWKAFTQKFDLNHHAAANITISCVDKIQARFEIAKVLKNYGISHNKHQYRPIYWMDFGNRQHTGQVLLSTISTIHQPTSRKFETVALLPMVTEEFGDMLRQSNDDDASSCSIAEALSKQDLFINSSLAQEGCALLWQLFRQGMTAYRGVWKNLQTHRTQPVPV